MLEASDSPSPSRRGREHCCCREGAAAMILCARCVLSRLSLLRILPNLTYQATEHVS